MNAPLPARVSNPPAKPLLIWDGECHFCRHWIERWRIITGSEVDYAPYQEIAERFPEIPREQFQRSVVYIDRNGQVFVAAAAVYRSLGCCRSKKWLWWSYQHVPGFAAVSELAYRVIAGNRPFASAMTRLKWPGHADPRICGGSSVVLVIIAAARAMVSASANISWMCG